ncbi:MAG: tetratricopeptide repeat protein [Muribaculaceae bacterium]|nr:tetratricopeptide repeat protein [Muribaculaceae bacterium]
MKKNMVAALAAAVLIGNCSVESYAMPTAQPCDITSPLTPGYLSRAVSMAEKGVWSGVIDQIKILNTLPATLTEEEAMQCAFLLARGAYERGESECITLLADFAEKYSASFAAPEARLAIADRYFFSHDWPDAFEAYLNVDFDRLNPNLQNEGNYRYLLSMIRTGHYDEAHRQVNKLKDKKGYENAYLFYSAYLYYIDGNFDRAYPIFEKVVPEEGIAPGYYMTQIQYSRAEFDEVIKHGTSLLRRNPDPELAPEIQRIVGLSYFKLNDPVMARGFLEGYLDKTKANPADADALYALGAIEYGDKDYSRTIELMRLVTEQQRIDATTQGAWLYLGQALQQTGQETPASLAYERASRMTADPKVSETATYNYLTSLTRGGKIPFSRSASLLEDFTRRFPDSPLRARVDAYLGAAYFNDHEYAKALNALNAIRRPDSEILKLKQKTLYELGVEMMNAGHADRAEQYLRECSAMTNQDSGIAAQSALWLGDALYSMRRYKESISAYKKFLDSDNATGSLRANRGLGLYDLAYAEYQLGNYTAAAGYFDNALKAKPALQTGLRQDALIRRADCLYYLQQRDDAEKLYSQAISEGAADTDYALYRRAVVRGLNGDTRGKISDLSRLDEEFANSQWRARGLKELAVTYEETGKTDLAAEAYRERLAATQDIDLDELLRMARAMQSAGQWNNLLEVNSRIRSIGGLEADELTELELADAEALASTGRNNEARDIYTRLAANPGSSAGSQSAVVLAETMLAEGNAEGAREAMENFTESGTPHQYWLARGFITLADAYHALGDTALAREYLLSLQENYPGNEADISKAINSRLKSWK